MSKVKLFESEFSKFHNSVYNDYNTLDSFPYSVDYFGSRLKFKILSSNDRDNFYIENYGNPLCSVRKYYFSISVEQNGPKISMKVFVGGRERRVGEPYFRVKKSMKFITINTELGDVYSGELIDYHKKKKCVKRVKKNYFLNDPINSLRTFVKNTCVNFDRDGNVIFEQALRVFLGRVDYNNNYVSLSPSKKIIKFYLDKKNIKYPNNFSVYFSTWVHENFRKELRKNGGKVVETVMKIYELQGKNVRKALHNCKNLQINTLKVSIDFFKDLIYNDYDLIMDILNMSFNLDKLPNRELFSKSELRKIFIIFKDCIQKETVSSWAFMDHLRMHQDLKNYGENVKWLSGGKGISFNDEHLDWTNRLEYFRRGIYKRIYPKLIYNSLKTFSHLDSKYFPVILDHTHNYSEETNHQSNCVKSYIGRASSFIISLRKENELGEERATVEYHVKKSDSKIVFKRVQTLGKYNSKLIDDWDAPLEKLDNIISSWNFSENDCLVEIQKECANGQKFQSDSFFDEDGFLRWTKNKDRKNTFFDYNIFD